MLILTRKPGESLYVIDGQKVVKVLVVEIKGNQIRLGIDAPVEQKIYREEIYLQILEENKKAAQGLLTDTSLEQLSGGWKSPAKGAAVGAAGGVMTSDGPAGEVSKRVSFGSQPSVSRAGRPAKAQGIAKEVAGTGSPNVGSEKKS